MATRSQRFNLTNLGRYDTPEVRRLVRFAMDDIDRHRVAVLVQDDCNWHGRGGRRNAFCARDRELLPAGLFAMVLWLPAPSYFPTGEGVCSHARGRKSTAQWPRYSLADWREGLVYLAAHEAKHIEQFRYGQARSEVRCEHFAAYMLRRYREELAAA